MYRYIGTEPRASGPSSAVNEQVTRETTQANHNAMDNDNKRSATRKNKNKTQSRKQNIASNNELSQQNISQKIEIVLNEGHKTRREKNKTLQKIMLDSKKEAADRIANLENVVADIEQESIVKNHELDVKDKQIMKAEQTIAQKEAKIVELGKRVAKLEKTFKLVDMSLKLAQAHEADSDCELDIKGEED